MGEERTIQDRVAEARSLGLPLVAVLDTNTLLEIFSLADLSREEIRLNEERTEASMEDPAVRLRLGRSYHALALAVELHQRRATTLSLGSELALTMPRVIDPDKPEEPDHHFIRHILGLVKEQILTDWAPEAPDLDAGLRNPERDRLLLEIAADQKVVLVTNEGNTEDGLKRQGLRELALDAGVDVASPKELNDRWGVDTNDAWSFLLGEMDRLAPGYLGSFPPANRQVMVDGLNILRGLLEVVCQFGEEAANPL